MDSPKHFRVWVNLSWFKASKSCTAEWSRRCLGKMARLMQVPPTLGHWVRLPPQPGRSGSIRMLSTWASTARWSEDSASRKQLASHGSCHRCSCLIHTSAHPEEPAPSCRTSSHPALSRCWANHLHLSLALLPGLTESQIGRYHSHFCEAQTQLLSVAPTLVSPWPFRPCSRTTALHEELCYWPSSVRMLGLPRWRSGWKSTQRAGDARDSDLTPGSGRSPGEGNGAHSNILAWRIQWSLAGYSTRGRKESEMTYWLNNSK